MKWHADEKGNCHAGCEARLEIGCGLLKQLRSGIGWTCPLNTHCDVLDVCEALGLDARDADHGILLHRVERIEHHLDRQDGGLWQMDTEKYLELKALHGAREAVGIPVTGRSRRRRGKS